MSAALSIHSGSGRRETRMKQVLDALARKLCHVAFGPEVSAFLMDGQWRAPLFVPDAFDVAEKGVQDLPEMASSPREFLRC